MPCLLVCSSSENVLDSLRRISTSVGWEIDDTPLNVKAAEMLVEHKADAVLIDLEHEIGDLRAFMSFLADAFPFFPLILLHYEEITDLEIQSGVQFHLRPDRTDELEHILISLSVMTHSSTDLPQQPIDMGAMVPRVLIVDDDVRLASAIARSLRAKERFDVQTAYSGFQAGAILPMFQPHVAIVDISLGDMDGRDVCTFIKEHKKLKHTSVIGISGIIDTDHLNENGHNFDDFLEKPFHIHEIVKKIETFLPTVRA